ncbi:hypothetical protein VPH35_046822 [Triticum aestivum]
MASSSRGRIGWAAFAVAGCSGQVSREGPSLVSRAKVAVLVMECGIGSALGGGGARGSGDGDTIWTAGGGCWGPACGVPQQTDRRPVSLWTESRKPSDMPPFGRRRRRPACARSAWRGSVVPERRAC